VVSGIRSGEGAWRRDEWELVLGLAASQVEAVEAFPSAPASVRAARSFVRGVLAGWGAVEDTADTAVLLTSEMATNAVLHARTPFSVLVARTGDRVAVAVADGSPLLPTMQRLGRTQTTGRGLRLLETLAEEWHVRERPSGGRGKAVWFALALAGPSRDDEALASGSRQDGSGWAGERGVDV
jgi:anti-sigma regulatory factor (Ser/Thr protein kinase)